MAASSKHNVFCVGHSPLPSLLLCFGCCKRKSIMSWNIVASSVQSSEQQMRMSKSSDYLQTLVQNTGSSCLCVSFVIILGTRNFISIFLRYSLIHSLTHARARSIDLQWTVPDSYLVPWNSRCVLIIKHSSFFYFKFRTVHFVVCLGTTNKCINSYQFIISFSCSYMFRQLCDILRELVCTFWVTDQFGLYLRRYIWAPWEWHTAAETRRSS
jgi:hypothetical protein